MCTKFVSLTSELSDYRTCVSRHVLLCHFCNFCLVRLQYNYILVYFFVSVCFLACIECLKHETRVILFYSVDTVLVYFHCKQKALFTSKLELPLCGQEVSICWQTKGISLPRIKNCRFHDNESRCIVKKRGFFRQEPRIVSTD